MKTRPLKLGSINSIQLKDVKEKVLKDQASLINQKEEGQGGAKPRTAYRILHTLAVSRFVLQDVIRGRYCLILVSHIPLAFLRVVITFP